MRVFYNRTLYQSKSIQPVPEAVTENVTSDANCGLHTDSLLQSIPVVDSKVDSNELAQGLHILGQVIADAQFKAAKNGK